jgi:hypothetical protein
MVVASWKDKNVTPVEACAWAVQKGYKAVSNGTYHSFFKPYGAVYGLTITQLTPGSVQSMTTANAKVYHDKALTAIKNGNLVICLMGKGKEYFETTPVSSQALLDLREANRRGAVQRHCLWYGHVQHQHLYPGSSHNR